MFAGKTLDYDDERRDYRDRRIVTVGKLRGRDEFFARADMQTNERAETLIPGLRSAPSGLRQRRSVYSHFFHLKKKYGSTAAKNIIRIAIG